ncbi:hypothetical protein [uncultured Sphingomonas sp.]|uniref:hypothetical protein n=1 Tax=uncultured Sphingomonas sp. TaxID=158754 RepID=UPI0025F332F6|nr:hypothetical protein [uncultured Sphingomonas sp.]
MNAPLIFTGHEGFAAALVEALAPFAERGCTIRHRPWNKGLHLVKVTTPADDDLRAEIGAEAWRAGVTFYESHAG